MSHSYHKFKKNDKLIINFFNYQKQTTKQTTKQPKSECLKPTICRLLLSRLLPQQIRLMVLKEIIQVYNTLHHVSKLFITLNL
jgi:hypothetical protein